MARNEALLRQVNERIEDVNESIGKGELTDFLCECGDESCTAPVSLTLTEYGEIRSDPIHFVIALGHETVGVERVVEENDRFAVVEKSNDEAEEIAVETDPRS